MQGLWQCAKDLGCDFKGGGELLAALTCLIKGCCAEGFCSKTGKKRHSFGPAGSRASSGDKKWSQCPLKVRPKESAEGLNVGHQRSRGVKGDFKDVCLHS